LSIFFIFSIHIVVYFIHRQRESAARKVLQPETASADTSCVTGLPARAKYRTCRLFLPVAPLLRTQLYAFFCIISACFDSGHFRDKPGGGRERKYSLLRDGIAPEEGALPLAYLPAQVHANARDRSAFPLYICEALSGQGSGRHTILDPGQYSDFHGVGIANLKRAGFDFFELIEKPALLAEGRKFQFALIDGWHTFDHTLLDLFYVNRLL
jgi:hypothetical protein